jgi:hypothetical protein
MSRRTHRERVLRFISALGIVGAGLGCTHEIGPAAGPPARPKPVVTPEQQTPPNGIGGGPSSADTAMNQAIRLRCAREERCDNIGLKRPYATMDDCIANVAIMHADDFAGLQCGESGVRADALRQCLQEIAREQCVPGARFAACRSIGLCNTI